MFEWQKCWIEKTKLLIFTISFYYFSSKMAFGALRMTPFTKRAFPKTSFFSIVNSFSDSPSNKKMHFVHILLSYQSNIFWRLQIQLEFAPFYIVLNNFDSSKSLLKKTFLFIYNNGLQCIFSIINLLPQIAPQTLPL